MSGILLTAYSGAILGPIAKVLGWVMDKIYMAMYNLFGIEDVALSIILLTILIYACLLPLTIKQQKFSKLSQKMQPELKAVQDKYKNRKDQASMQAMQQETSLIYQKYGVSPTGSCVQLLIQMPILFALYRVFYNVPAYIVSIKDQFSGLVSEISSTTGYQDKMVQIMSDYNMRNLSVKFEGADQAVANDFIVDILYKLPKAGWENLTSYFPNVGSEVEKITPHINNFNYFAKLNISDTPLNIIKTSFAAHSWFILVLAILIPALAYLTQVLNIKLMPQTSNGNDQMAQQMKTMNLMMPLMSFVMCFTVPVGLGIYWIAGAVCRSVQQVFINKKFENLDLEEIIKKNEEKAKKKREKMGISENQIRNAASMNTRKMDITSKANTMSSAERELELEKAAVKKANAKQGSMASKANMVKDFNERNTRK